MAATASSVSPLAIRIRRQIVFGSTPCAAGGYYLGGVGIADAQDARRAVICFVLAALAVIVADMLRPGKPSYR